jgi:hypothetical protein
MLPDPAMMDAPMEDALAAQETRALLARMARRGDDAYEQAMLSCLATAQQALHACTQPPLLRALARELADLARHCQRDADLLAQQVAAQDGNSPRELDAARRVADAARELAELAWLKASQAS